MLHDVGLIDRNNIDDPDNGDIYDNINNNAIISMVIIKIIIIKISMIAMMLPVRLWWW